MLEQIVEGDGEAGELEDVGHHGHWGQVLEVPDATQEANGDQGKGHVHPVVNKTKVHQEYLETLWLTHRTHKHLTRSHLLNILTDED